MRKSISKLPVIEERVGRVLGPKATMYAIPAMASGMPIGAKVNMPMGSRPMSFSVPFTRRFVDVPIRVQQPPRMDE